jgi:hypothetical protein
LNPLGTLLGVIVFIAVCLGLVSLCKFIGGISNIDPETRDREQESFDLKFSLVCFAIPLALFLFGWLVESGVLGMLMTVGAFAVWIWMLKEYFLGFFEKKKPNAPQGGTTHKGKSASNFRKKSGSK